MAKKMELQDEEQECLWPGRGKESWQYGQLNTSTRSNQTAT